jgi:hypothetical protein
MPEEDDPVAACKMELMSMPDVDERSEFSEETELISFTSSFCSEL